MYTDHVNFMCTWLHAETYLNVYTCPCTHVYIQTQTYPCIHMCTRVHMLAHPDAFAQHCTPTYVQTRTLHVYTDAIHRHVHTFVYRTTFKDLRHVHALSHSDSRTGSPLLPMLSNQADHWFLAPWGWLSLPSLPLPSPSIMVGSSCSCQPQCLPSASHPPRAPRSLINPLANWPPAP